MTVLGPDGEPVHPLGQRVEVPSGRSVDLTFKEETTLTVGGRHEIVLPPGEWRILPLDAWRQVVAQAAMLETQVATYRAALNMAPDDDLPPVGLSRQARRHAMRRASRDLRN